MRPGILLRATAVTAALLALSGCGGSKEGMFPSDEEMRVFFEKRQADLQELASMAREDSHLWRIAPDRASVYTGQGKFPRDPTEAEYPKERRERYQKLFKSLGMPIGLTWERSVLYLPVMVQQQGNNDSEEKGFALGRPPGKELAALDGEKLAIEHGETAYVPLEGDWYMYRRYNE